MLISLHDAKRLIANICNDFGLDIPRLQIKAVRNDRLGDYAISDRQPTITIYGDIIAETVIHEIAHHVQYRRRPETMRAHNLAFYRICFELRNHIRECYGVDFANIAGEALERTASYGKALDEWFAARQAAA